MKARRSSCERATGSFSRPARKMRPSSARPAAPASRAIARMPAESGPLGRGLSPSSYGQHPRASPSMATMNDRPAPNPRHPVRSSARRVTHRRPWAVLGGSLLVAALLAPGSTAAVRPPHSEPAAAAPEGSTGASGAVALGIPTTADIALDQRVGSLNSPVFITSARDGTDRFFIVEQTGRIKIWVPGSGVRSTPFLSLVGEVSLAFERGLLGLAFHPDYETNRRLYVYFTRSDGDIVVREYKARLSNPNRVNEDSARLV